MKKPPASRGLYERLLRERVARRLRVGRGGLADDDHGAVHGGHLDVGGVEDAVDLGEKSGQSRRLPLVIRISRARPRASRPNGRELARD